MEWLSTENFPGAQDSEHGHKLRGRACQGTPQAHSLFLAECFPHFRVQLCWPENEGDEEREVDRIRKHTWLFNEFGVCLFVYLLNRGI